jgi:hypothetical protein
MRKHIIHEDKEAGSDGEESDGNVMEVRLAKKLEAAAMAATKAVEALIKQQQQQQQLQQQQQQQQVNQQQLLPQHQQLHKHQHP